MKPLSFLARSFKKRKLLTVGAFAAVLIGLMVLVGGCVTITTINIGGNVPAGSNHLISMTLTATTDATSPIRGVIAIRIPAAWDIKTVSFTGALTGGATESAVMEGVYATEWESMTGDGYNGHKDGYKWWVGYSAASTFASGDISTVTIAFDSNGRGGTYLLDFVMGIADATTPEADPAANSGFWQIGSAGLNPIGVSLDQAITLYCFTDVLPGTPYFDAIQGLGARAIIQGYGPQAGGYFEFRGTNSVMRAQFTKFITGALNAAGIAGYDPVEGMMPPVNFPDLGPDNPA
ncbi:MAG TPA: S-layer homology domain-containing protein, partial [Thermoleophilia bacterium]|nr:S-layer homology domain-containing protein [Thermoleophilia bacterium]